MTVAFKQPISVLVVVHSPELDILLLQRTRPKGFWQSVTGSLEAGETPAEAARREVFEETGIDAAQEALVDWHHTNRFVIREEWRHRYAPEVSHNVEHVFSLCVPRSQVLRLAADEHDAFLWLPRDEAAARVFSWTNRDAILRLGERYAAAAVPGDVHS